MLGVPRGLLVTVAGVRTETGNPPNTVRKLGTRAGEKKKARMVVCMSMLGISGASSVNVLVLGLFTGARCLDSTMILG